MYIFLFQNGLNALHLASKEGHVPVVLELVKRGANVNAATKVNMTLNYKLAINFHLEWSNNHFNS